MKRIIIIIFGLIILFISCKQKNSPINESIPEKSVENTINNSEDIKFTDILINKDVDSSSVLKITKSCIFFPQLTTKECDSLENEDPDAYEIFSEHLNSNATNALELLEKLKIKNYWSDKKYILFKSEKDEYLFDPRIKKLAGEYCIIFRKELKPEILRIDLLKEETLSKYFKQ